MSKKTETVEQLEARVQEIDKQLQELREEKRSVRARIDGQMAAEAARRRLESMSDAERAALAQMIAPEGGSFVLGSGN